MSRLGLPFAFKKCVQSSSAILSNGEQTFLLSKQVGKISTTQCMQLKPKKWPKYRNWAVDSEYELNRIGHGLSRTGREYGPFVDKPDWSYADGRSGVLSDGGIRRREFQKAIAEDVKNKSEEIKYIQENAEQILERIDERPPGMPNPQPSVYDIHTGYIPDLPKVIGGVPVRGAIAATKLGLIPARKIRGPPDDKRQRKFRPIPPRKRDWQS